MAKKFIVQPVFSKKTGKWFWRMKGSNGEKMAHSETMENKSHVRRLMIRFEQMGFEIDWGKF